MHRRTTVRVLAGVVLAGVVLAGALAGCSGSDGGSPLIPTASSASSTPVVSKGVAPDTSSVTPAAPSSTAPTPARSTRSSTPPAGLRDFRDVTFSVPSGFQVSTDYSPLTPLETDYASHFVVPTNSTNSKEVIGMYVYALPAGRTVTSRTDQVAMIKAFNTKAKAVVSGSGIRKAVTAIDGVPAYTETATEPGDYTYIAYWAFGTHHFLLYSCQLGSTSSVGTLAVACGTTLASLQLN